jgi:hypothetical protein
MPEERDYQATFARECTRLGVDPGELVAVLQPAPGELPWLISLDRVLGALAELPDGVGPATATEHLSMEFQQIRRRHGGPPPA